MNFNVTHLLDYTEWERNDWHSWLRQNGEQVLKMSAGPHGDGRFPTIGDLIRHIFAAEKRYVERLYGRPLTDYDLIPNDSIGALFGFGMQSRRDLKELLETFPASDWNVSREFKILQWVIHATPNKIIAHTLMHEVRHWAQIATMLRLNGLKVDFHDFLASPVMGGDWKQ